MSEEDSKHLLIEGSGSSKKPKKQAPPVEAPNTLRSTSIGRILDLISYGPIKGPVDGLKSVFLDDTPVQNADGSLNFEGIDLEFRNGDPDQDVIPGFVDVSNPREINAEVKFASPLVRTLLNNEADAVVVTVRVPALLVSDTTSGNTNPTSLPLTIQVTDGMGNTVASLSDTISGKNTSPYERSYRLNFKGQGPFSVRVSRNNQESEKQEKRDALHWAYLTEVIDIRQSYPNCAMFGISVDAQLFGSSIPARSYLVDLSIVKIPSNYNPLTRAYTGFWDGTFKEDWTDNPAWCYYDLATHPIIGAGIAEVNKWALYEIAKYCDQLVSDGYGGMEPRFTCNTIFASQEDAITALNTLASVFRGMTYWGSDTVEPVADMPGPIRKIIGPSDVIDGEFSYQGTSLKDRHSVAVVMWNDPEDGYVSKPEMVEDPESIELLGWRELQITAVACTSRGQARRLGLWALYSERAETQSLSFGVTAKHADFRPGDFFEVQDPYRAGARLSGKVAHIAGREFTLDAVPAQLAVGWKITLETEEGGLQQLTISRVAGKKVTVSTAPTRPIALGASFALSSATISSQTFRVASVMEQEGSTYGITATAHDPRKYRHIEEGLKLPDIPTSFVPTGRLGAPTAISAQSYTYWAGGTENQGLTIGWTGPDDARATNFMLDVKGPDDIAFGTVYTGSGLSFDLPLVSAGLYYFRVRATSTEWGNSAWKEGSLELTNLLAPKQPLSLIFRTTSNTVTILPQFEGVNAEFEFWRSPTELSLTQVESNATYLGTGSFFVDNKLAYDTTYYYYVRGVNLYGSSGWVPGQAKTTADVDDILDVILKEQQSSPVGQWFKKEIDKISGPASMPGSVSNRVDAVDTKFDIIFTELETEVNTSNHDLQEQLTLLKVQLSEFSNAAQWDPLIPYDKNSIVQWQGKLYTAKDAVAAGVEPTDSSDFWTKIGDFVSLTDAISDLAIRVETSEVRTDVIEGVVTPIVSQLNTMSARWREWDAEEDGYLEGALEAWDVRADFSEEVKVRASEVEALSQRITNFNTQLGDLGSSITTLEQSLTNEISSVAQSVTQLEGKVGEDISSAILAERVVRVTAEEALASSIEALEVTIEEDISAAILFESQVRADEDEALGLRIDAVSSDFGDSSAAVQQQITALTNADTALGNRIDTVTANTVIADDKAVAAQTAADAAKQDAAAAAGLADSKGMVIVQPTAPTGGRRVPQNLWINTTGGANTPHRWNVTTSKWEEVTDKVAKDAAIAAAEADRKARAAQDGVEQNTVAISNETTARTDADSALGVRIEEVKASTLVNKGAIESAEVLIVENTALIQAETKARTDENSAQASQINNLEARSRELDEDEDGYLNSAVDAFESNARFFQEVVVRTEADKALARRVTQLSTEVGDVSSSLTTVEESLSTEIESVASSVTVLEAKVGEGVETAIAEERVVRASADEALSQRIVRLDSNLSNDISQNTAAIAEEKLTRTTNEGAAAQRVAALEARTANTEEGVSDNYGLIQAEELARTNAISALASTVSQVSASTVIADDKAVAAQTTANTAKQDAAAASGLAASKGEVIIQPSAPTGGKRLPQNLWINTTNGGNTPNRWNVSTTKWEPVTDKVAVDAAAAAVAADNKAKAAQTTANKAAADILLEVTARTSADTALGQRITTTQASVDDVSASVQQVESAQVAQGNKLSAMWGVKLQVNNKGEYVTAGVGLGIENAAGNLQSNFIVQADKFTVINGLQGAQQTPFAVDGDKVIIRSAFIGDATITMAKIAGNLYSTNYVAGVSGWRLERNGNFEINSPVAGQGRILINNKGMRVYDAAGKIRVKIGDLT